MDLIQAIVRDQLQAHRTAELGVVTKVHSHASGSDKNNYECDVRLRDSGLELKRVALCTQRVGSVAIPNPDDMVLVQYLNGDVNSAVITGRLYNDQVRSPEAKAHEFVYISPDSAESGIRRIYMELPNGNKLLLARPVDPRDRSRLEGGYLVAVDTVDAGVGETVLIVSGSSARMASGMKDCPVDAAVVGIVDSVDLAD